jgi:hypothetical protein
MLGPEFTSDSLFLPNTFVIGDAGWEGTGTDILWESETGGSMTRRFHTKWCLSIQHLFCYEGRIKKYNRQVRGKKL